MAWMPIQSVYLNPQMWSLVVWILTAPQRLVLKAWSSAAVVRGGIFGRYLTDEGSDFTSWIAPFLE